MEKVTMEKVPMEKVLFGICCRNFPPDITHGKFHLVPDDKILLKEKPTSKSVIASYNLEN